jgi:two-component system sensor histidine kinase KdpD
MIIIICTMVLMFAILFDKAGIGRENVLLFFLIGTLVTATLIPGFIYGVIVSVGSVVLYSYYFTDPLYSLNITEDVDAIHLGLFLTGALITGTVSARSNRQTEIARIKEHDTQIMYEVIESFINLSGIGTIVRHGIDYIYKYTGYPCMVVLENPKLSDKDSVYKTLNYPDGPDDKYTFSIKVISNKIGTLTLGCVIKPLSDECRTLIASVIHQMAIVLDREFINADRIDATLSIESERFKSTLLRSISHDIRTPLTGILGASDTIAEDYDTLDEASIRRLARDIHEESAWLITTVQNILDMTRISDGKFSLKTDYEAVDDLIAQVVSRASFLTNDNRLKVNLSNDIILVKVDGKLFVQVLFNLLDNAYKHAGKNAVVEISVKSDKDNVIFEVSDNGPGIDDSIVDSLFEGFVTMPSHSSDKGRGVGLGLNICKSIVLAHGGEIYAGNNTSGGATFTIKLSHKGE